MDFLGYLGLRASLRVDFVLNLHDVLIVRILSPCLLLTALAATSRAFLTAKGFSNFNLGLGKKHHHHKRSADPSPVSHHHHVSHHKPTAKRFSNFILGLSKKHEHH